MASTGSRWAPIVAFAFVALLRLPSDAAEQPTHREYEVRLAAHRRELMQREADLEAARVELRQLRQRTEVRANAPLVLPAAMVEIVRDEVPEPVATSRVSTSAEHPSEVIALLERDLEVERENRSTLEQELQRLAADPPTVDLIEPLRRSLEGADAQLLVLRHQVVAERKAREALEIDLERARHIAGVTPTPDWLDRFATTMQERRDQTARLEQQLGETNEVIVGLKARLESASSGSADPKLLRALGQENSKLRAALNATEQANADLRTQADLAAHLAEMLYGQSR